MEGRFRDVKDGCVFCDYEGPSPVLVDYGHVIVFEPLQPVTPGHVLVVPKWHVVRLNQWAGSEITVAAGWYVVSAGIDSYNFIVSVGREATQTVPHLHGHLIPRREGDGLPLPWSPKVATKGMSQ